ncbi:carboxyl transferase domain-containing protein [Actinomadura sp. HBU206391]|uniref:carboxyl transferase domain-containing protein n=1 Tax=Actinomadura sp. HBU206391 TaxID=2731692 RepID=UPI00164F95F4|nr:carboxyl transferase domain-containing protein [Actinomadura sp. HBU206391]MBC6462694.1 acetyl-CoA carboxyl transferase [Actinomadura sp. HBU206391]
MTARVDARALVARVLDAGSWISWDDSPQTPSSGPGAPAGSCYERDLAAARRRTGYDEAVVTGEGTLCGRRVALVMCESSFLGGSIGTAAAERLVRAAERATGQGLPLLAAPASGGVRMQEGTTAFVQLARVAAAVTRHRAAGLPFLSYLRHPTTGGVLASLASLGHFTVAEPGALIGFLGPRVYEALCGESFPPGVQTAENLYAHGVIDAVVAVEEFGAVAARALDVLCAPRHATQRGRPGAAPAESGHPRSVPTDVPAWEAIERTRRDDRPGVRDVLRVGARDVTVLSGTGEGETEPGVVLALARFGTAPCVVVGQDRHGQRIRPLGPAGLRVARRGMRLAAELWLPVVTVIDTPGAALSPEAEQRGLAGEIARCLADLIAVPAPTVSVLLGEGAGGAALALLPADRVLCARHAWLSPLPPEGASVILHRTTDRASEMAQAQGVRSLDLLRDGIVDRVIAECPDAADEAEEFCGRVAGALASELADLLDMDESARPAARRHRTFDRWRPRA